MTSCHGLALNVPVLLQSNALALGLPTGWSRVSTGNKEKKKPTTVRGKIRYLNRLHHGISISVIIWPTLCSARARPDKRNDLRNKYVADDLVRNGMSNASKLKSSLTDVRT